MRTWVVAVTLAFAALPVSTEASASSASAEFDVAPPQKRGCCSAATPDPAIALAVLALFARRRKR
jgi:MYXO-CTERM domain-containing protein